MDAEALIDLAGLPDRLGVVIGELTTLAVIMAVPPPPPLTPVTGRRGEVEGLSCTPPPPGVDRDGFCGCSGSVSGSLGDTPPPAAAGVDRDGVCGCSGSVSGSLGEGGPPPGSGDLGE